MKHVKVAGVSVLAVAVLVGLVLTLTAQVPPGKLPGLVSADSFPKGCVDCHKVQADGSDYRLTAELKKNPKHPDITAMVKNVPADCATCHRPGVAAGPIASVVHKNHYEAKGNSVFVKTYGGECLNCHAVNPTTFEMKAKNAPKNW